MKSNCRAFLKTSATFLAAAPVFVRGSNLNSKLQIASIGTNGKGYSDISKMADHKAAIHVAFCDVDLARAEKALEIQPSDGFDYGGPLTEAVQLGNIALRFKDKTLKWDANSLTFTNLEPERFWRGY